MNKKIDKELKNIISSIDKYIIDPRKHNYKVKYHISDIIFLTIIGYMMGYGSLINIHDRIKLIFDSKEYEYIKKFLKVKDKKWTCYSNYHKIIDKLDKNDIENLIKKYFKSDKFCNLSLDGKSLKNTRRLQTDNKAIIIMNIVDRTTGISINHFESENNLHLDEHKDVIKIIDEYRNNGNILFTFDAISTKTEVLNTISSSGNNYIARLKANNKKDL